MSKFEEKRQRELRIQLNAKNIIKGIALCAVLFGAFLFGFIYGATRAYQVFYPEAYNTGFLESLTQIKQALALKSIELTWTQQPDGSYGIVVKSLSDGAIVSRMNLKVHLLVQQFRPYELLDSSLKSLADQTPFSYNYWQPYLDINGNSQLDFPNEYRFLISETYHPMNTTNEGLDWIEQMIWTDTNSTQEAVYFATSNSETAVSLAWVILPSEETGFGLLRASGNYYSAGVGSATVNKTFTITGTVSSCLYGLYADSRANDLNSLIAAEQQGAGSRKNMAVDDTLTLTITWTLTDA